MPKRVEESPDRWTPPIVAVFDVETKGIEFSEDELESLNDYLATRLAETGVFQVVPREDIRKRIMEKKKDSYRPSCDRSCQIELGQEVAAEQSLSTQLSKMGSKCMVTMALYDLRKAATAAAATVRGRCDTDAVMASLAAGADKIASKVRPESAAGRKWVGKVTVTELTMPSDTEMGKNIVNTVVDESGFLYVESEPKGSTVLINGEEKGKTPYQAELMVGKYVVVCTKGALYFPARQKVKMTQKVVRLKMELKPNFGVLRVTSDPPGAAVELNGEPTGKATPVTFQPRRAGFYLVKLTKDLYLSRTVRVELGEGKKTPVEIELIPNFGTISVDSSPQGAEVYLNGNPTGKNTPVRLEHIAAGLHQVDVRSRQYHPETRRVSVDRGKESSLSLELKGKYGMLVVTAAVVDEAQDSPSQAEVWLNGEKMVQPTPFKGKFLVGSYRVEVRTEEAKEFVTVVQIEEGKKTHVQAKMEKMLPEEVRIQREAKRLALYDERKQLWLEKTELVRSSRSKYHWTGGLLIAGSAVASLAGLLLWALPMKGAMNRRDEAYNKWLVATSSSAVEHYQSTMRDEDDLAKTYHIAGWIGIGTSATLLVGGIVTLILSPTPPGREEFFEGQRSLELRPILNSEGGSLIFKFAW